MANIAPGIMQGIGQGLMLMKQNHDEKKRIEEEKKRYADQLEWQRTTYKAERGDLFAQQAMKFIPDENGWTDESDYKIRKQAYDVYKKRAQDEYGVNYLAEYPTYYNKYETPAGQIGLLKDTKGESGDIRAYINKQAGIGGSGTPATATPAVSGMPISPMSNANQLPPTAEGLASNMGGLMPPIDPALVTQTNPMQRIMALAQGNQNPNAQIPLQGEMPVNQGNPMMQNPNTGNQPVVEQPYNPLLDPRALEGNGGLNDYRKLQIADKARKDLRIYMSDAGADINSDYAQGLLKTIAQATGESTTSPNYMGENYSGMTVNQAGNLDLSKQRLSLSKAMFAYKKLDDAKKNGLAYDKFEYDKAKDASDYIFNVYKENLNNAWKAVANKTSDASLRQRTSNQLQDNLREIRTTRAMYDLGADDKKFAEMEKETQDAIDIMNNGPSSEAPYLSADGKTGGYSGSGSGGFTLPPMPGMGGGGTGLPGTYAGKKVVLPGSGGSRVDKKAEKQQLQIKHEKNIIVNTLRVAGENEEFAHNVAPAVRERLAKLYHTVTTDSQVVDEAERLMKQHFYTVNPRYNKNLKRKKKAKGK